MGYMRSRELCAAPLLTATVPDAHLYLVPPRNSFTHHEFAVCVMVVVAAIVLSHWRRLNVLIEITTAVVLVYATWAKDFLDRSGWQDVCSVLDVGQSDVKQYLYLCIAFWMSSFILDVKSSMLVIFKFRKNALRRRFRPSQRLVVLIIGVLVIDAFAALLSYMYSEYKSSTLLTSDPWIHFFFWGSAGGKVLSIGCQGCLFSRALATGQWTLPENDGRRSLMAQTWVFNATTLVNTGVCLWTSHSSLESVLLMVYLAYRFVIFTWVFHNTELNLKRAYRYPLVDFLTDRVFHDQPAAIEDHPPAAVEDRPPAAVEDRPPTVVEDRPPAAVEDRPPTAVEDRPPAAVEDRQPAAVEDRPPAAIEDRQPAVIDNCPAIQQQPHPPNPKVTGECQLWLDVNIHEARLQETVFVVSPELADDPGPGHFVPGRSLENLHSKDKTVMVM